MFGRSQRDGHEEQEETRLKGLPGHHQGLDTDNKGGQPLGGF